MSSMPLLNVDPADAITPLKPEATLRCNDKYVIVYDFSDVGKKIIHRSTLRHKF